MRDEQDISNGDKPLFFDRFSRENDLVAALHEGGIAGVSQDADEQDNDNYNDDSNTNEDPDDPPGISLETAASCSEIARVPPENPVELPGVSPPGNEVDDDFVPPLLPSEYDSNN